MGRKRLQPGHDNHERWLVSYADFITLMFAFFVVMFASSQADKTKVKQVSAAVSRRHILPCNSGLHESGRLTLARVFCRLVGVKKKRRPTRSVTCAQNAPSAAPPWAGQALDVAIRCQQAGQAEQAKQLYIRILEQQPDHALALRNLGIIARESGDFPLALSLSERALALRPDRPEFHACFAIALGAAGHREKADAAFQLALRLDPNCVDALFNYGNALKKRHRLSNSRYFCRAAFSRTRFPTMRRPSHQRLAWSVVLPRMRASTPCQKSDCA